MAKRKMLKTANGPAHGAFIAGVVYDFGALGCEEFGQALEAAGAAERVFEAAVEPRAERAVEPPVDVPKAEAPEPEPLPKWPLKKYGPAEYLETYGNEAKHSALAQKYTNAGKLHG